MATPYGSAVERVWLAGHPGTGKLPASAPGRVAYVYIHAPSSPGFINPIRAWGELGQLGEAGLLLSGPSALLIAIVPVEVLFGWLTSRRLVRRVRRLEAAAAAVADGTRRGAAAGRGRRVPGTRCGPARTRARTRW